MSEQQESAFKLSSIPNQVLRGGSTERNAILEAKDALDISRTALVVAKSAQAEAEKKSQDATKKLATAELVLSDARSAEKNTKSLTKLLLDYIKLATGLSTDLAPILDKYLTKSPITEEVRDIVVQALKEKIRSETARIEALNYRLKEVQESVKPLMKEVEILEKALEDSRANAVSKERMTSAILTSVQEDNAKLLLDNKELRTKLEELSKMPAKRGNKKTQGFTSLEID